MANGMGVGVLLIIGLLMVFGGLMWDASVGMAWQDLANNTTEGTTQHAAVSAGQIFGYGYGMILVMIGVLVMVGAFIGIAMSTFGSIKTGR